MSTNIENFLLLIEDLNKTIDYLIVEQSGDTWTGATLSGTNKEIKGGEKDDEEKIKDEVKEKWGENFVGEEDNGVYDILTEEEWIELVGENGEDAIKNLSTEDIEKVVLLKGAPKIRGYILRSGKYAGKMVVKPLLKSAKLVRGLVAGKKLSTLVNKKAKKVSGFCFCNELANEHDDSSSAGDWKKIRKNIKEKIKNETYTKGEGKIILRRFDDCAEDLGANVTDTTERLANASDCNVMKDALSDFDNIMSPILSELGKYFRLKDLEREKSIKGKNVGDILGGAKEVKIKFMGNKDVTVPGGTVCTGCFSNSPDDGKIKVNDVLKIRPTGGQGDRTIRCTWESGLPQKTTSDYILMTFENAKFDVQTIEFTFYKSDGTKRSQKTTISGKIVKIEN